MNVVTVCEMVWLQLYLFWSDRMLKGGVVAGRIGQPIVSSSMTYHVMSIDVVMSLVRRVGPYLQAQPREWPMPTTRAGLIHHQEEGGAFFGCGV